MVKYMCVCCKSGDAIMRNAPTPCANVHRRRQRDRRGALDALVEMTEKAKDIANKTISPAFREIRL